MSRKIQFHTFHLLFRLFSYLADKSGGWSMFVRPKLVMGALIVGITHPSIAMAQKENANENILTVQVSDSLMHDVSCYEPVTSITEMPEFPGGQDSMFQYISKHIVYPEKAIRDKIGGMVICQFTINEIGTVSDIKIVKGVNPLLDAEAVRVIKTFPKWKPGKRYEKAADVTFTIPFHFNLPKQ